VKIALVNPPYRGPGNAGTLHRGVPVFPPSEVSPHLGLGYIASSLAGHGVPCSVVDGDLLGLDHAGVCRECERERPDLVGVSFLHDSFPDCQALARRIGQELRVPVFAGGHLPTIVPDDFLLSSPEVDFALIGEAEVAVAALAAVYRSRPDWEQHVPGLVYRDETGAVRRGGPPVLPDINSLRAPERYSARHLFARQDSAHLPRALRVLASRGCGHQCSFCSTAAFYRTAPAGQRRRERDVRDVVDEIEVLVRSHGVRTIYFSDDDFIGPRQQAEKRIPAFCDALKRRDLEVSFSLSCRLDHASAGLLNMLRDAGLRHVGAGLESISSEALRFLNKGANSDPVVRFVEAAVAMDLSVSLYMILYHPLATTRELWDNYRFLESIGYFDGPIGQRNAFQTLVASRLVVRRGTPMEGVLSSLGLHRGYLPGNPFIVDYAFMDEAVGRFWKALTQAVVGCESDALSVFVDLLSRGART